MKITRIYPILHIIFQQNLNNIPNPDIPEKEDFKHASDLIRYLKPKEDFCLLGACYPECHPQTKKLFVVKE